MVPAIARRTLHCHAYLSFMSASRFCDASLHFTCIKCRSGIARRESSFVVAKIVSEFLVSVAYSLSVLSSEDNVRISEVSFPQSYLSEGLKNEITIL
jgi:hypothetical protein